MFNPILIIGAFILIDLIFSYFNKKDDSQKNIPESKQGKRQGNSILDMIKGFEDKITDSMKQEPRKTEVQENVSPVRREGRVNLAREEIIREQEAKVTRHSDMEKGRRLERDTILRASRLSESQVPLAEKDPKRRMQNYDLGKKQEISIKATELKDSEARAKKGNTLNIKDDILKAVIYSEILAKPKSLE